MTTTDDERTNAIASQKALYAPPYPPLRGSRETSFAYVTLKDRLPVIITKTIDSLCRFLDRLTRNVDQFEAQSEDLIVQQYKRQCGADSAALVAFWNDQGRQIIAEWSRLRYELQCNKPLAPLSEHEALPRTYMQRLHHFQNGKREDLLDLEVDDEELANWNSLIDLFKQEKNEQWFQCPWLFAECFVYRRLFGSMLKLDRLSAADPQRPAGWSWALCYDPFAEQKRSSFFESEGFIMEALLELNARCSPNEADLQRNFKHFLQRSLWGNQMDLSLQTGQPGANSQQHFHSDLAAASQTHLLADNSDEIWDYLCARAATSPSGDKPIEVHIVLDNAGTELSMDLCLADWLLQSKQCDRVVFHAKAMPWFVSDVLSADVTWLMDHGFHLLAKRQKEANVSRVLLDVHSRWQSYFKKGQWQVQSDLYWNRGSSYWHLATEAPKLFSQFCTPNTLLILFKGDLNYRKLIYDCEWPYPYTSTFSDAIGPDLRQLPLVTLRTCKADVVVGLKDGMAQKLDASVGTNVQYQGWLVTGKFGLVQFHRPQEECHP